MNETIQRIIEAGVLAPSIDNCQPWLFDVEGDVIDAYLDRDRASFFGDYGFTASYVTMGALLENMTISAAAAGYGCKVELFPSAETDGPIFRLRVAQDGETEDALLASHLAIRTTDRYPYRKDKLSHEAIDRLHATSAPEGARLQLFDSPGVMHTFFEMSAAVDSVIFSHRLLHANLFKWVRWSRADSNKTRDGLPVDCLGLAPPVAAFFRFIASWPRLDALNRLGLNKLIGMMNSRLLLNSSCVGLITMNGTSNEAYINGGRYFQRIWLTASALGLSFQPFGGIPFLLTRVIRAGQEGFTPVQYETLRRVMNRFSELGTSPESHALIALFRIGYHKCRNQRKTQRRPLSEVIATRN